jgi:succinoglycan biosynthesis transport protein ExoP
MIKSTKTGRLRIAVGIATAGRPVILEAALAMIARQTRPADVFLVAPMSDADIVGIDLAAYGARRIHAEKGLCAQRNAIVTASSECDVIAFFDDDFFPCRDYLAAVELAFLEELDVVMTTGTVLVDGVTGPGLTMDAGKRLIAQNERSSTTSSPRRAVYNAYGCNMAFRLEPTRGGILFDEGLPQYGWLEDVDFSRRLAPYGRIVKLPDARGIHLGSKSGRTAGVRLGYSQIANPLYLVRKHTLTPSRALGQMARNMVMNLLRSFVPEPYIDRSGRVHGNALAILDWLKGTSHPKNIDGLP